MLEAIRIFDSAISSEVALALRRQIETAAVPSVGENSRTASGKTFWFSFSATPRTLFDQMAVSMRKITDPHCECTGAEWWFRVQPPDSGFPMHFDRDEARKDHLITPAVASILYLSDEGLPTAILNQEANQAAPEELTAVPIFPKLGRFAIFPGALMHGVLDVAETASLPQTPEHWIAVRDPSLHRVAMFMNFWHEKPLGVSTELEERFLVSQPRQVLPIGSFGRPVTVAAVNISSGAE